MRILLVLSLYLLLTVQSHSQAFYYGADQSYVNEMEDCGVVYKEEGVAKDIYQIFREHGNNLVRLRLWHTPKWYDNLNEGHRYSDLDDVAKAIDRAKEQSMSVLLDFHLSDTWADPSKQIIPEAWKSDASDLPVLKDSLYHYIYNTLDHLSEKDLLPEMVQIGNETNKGILQTEEDNVEWKLEWPRNAELFNTALRAVSDFEADRSVEVKKMIHFAGPEDALWLMEQFDANGVANFDIIGLSYYWAWHQPTTIERTGEIIEFLKSTYEKEVMIVETGYIWTTGSNDQANNIISEIDESYGPASPESQKAWLIDLREEVKSSGGMGMIYWEPSWVSSGCRTLWGQGSHQEHATFFDFQNDLNLPGGIEWMEENTVSSEEQLANSAIDVMYDTISHEFVINNAFKTVNNFQYSISDISGRVLGNGKIKDRTRRIFFQLDNYQAVVLMLHENGKVIYSRQFVIGD